MTRFLLVRHPSGWLAIDAGGVERILALPRLSGLPGSRGHVIGAFRLGGRIVPVVDLDRRWGTPPAPNTTEDRLILDRAGVALRAGEPRSLVEAEIQPLPEEAVLLPQARPFLRGAVSFPEGVAAVLDLARVLEVDEGEVVEGEPLDEGWSEGDLARLQERSRSYAAEEDGGTPPDSRSMAVLRIGEGRYAVPIEQVREFVRLERVVPVPGAPPGMLGMTLLRGRILPVLDGRRLVGQAAGVSSGLAVVIPAPQAAVVVDEVEEVRHVELARIHARRVDLPDGPAGLLDLALLAGAHAAEQRIEGGRP